MYDQAIRSVWLEDQLWPKLRSAFPGVMYSLPENALITVGYPTSGARGRSEKIKPAEINTQWQGNSNEQVFIAIHPVYFDTPENVTKALLFAAAKRVSARWGPSQVGLSKRADSTIDAEPDTQAKIGNILTEIGTPPSGYGVAFPVRQVERTRMRKYVCSTRLCSDDSAHPVIRAASDTLDVHCHACGNPYVKD